MNTVVQSEPEVPDSKAMSPVERVAFINDCRRRCVAREDLSDELLREAIRAVSLGIQETAATVGTKSRKAAKPSIDTDALFDDL